MEFLQEHMVTQEGMQTFVRQEIQEAKTEIMTNVDRFVTLHQTLDQELVAMRSKYERLEERLELVEHKLGLAAA